MAKTQFDFVIIDTPARPSESELEELVEGCELLLLPTTTDSLSISATALTIKSLPEGTNYWVICYVTH